MNIYVMSDNYDHYDISVVDKVINGKFNIYNLLNDPLIEDSLFLMELDWFVKIADTQLESIKSLKNKKIIIFNTHKSLLNDIGKERCLVINEWMTRLSFKKENVYIITQMLADRQNLLPYFNSENITFFDKWLHELYRFQIINDLRKPKRLESMTQITKRFSFFNRRYSTERFHFISELVASGLIDNFIYTFTNNLGFNVTEQLPLDTVKTDIPAHLESKRNVIEEWVNGFPYTVGESIEDPYSNELGDLYKQANINIVYETHPITDGSIITEKTYKSMYFLKPFIILSQPGALQILKNSGYKTYSPFIDETYDLIEDYDLRVKAILNEITRLNNMSTDEFNQLIVNCKSIAEHNQQQLLMTMFNPLPDTFKASNLLNFEKA